MKITENREKLNPRAIYEPFNAMLSTLFFTKLRFLINKYAIHFNLATLLFSTSVL